MATTTTNEIVDFYIDNRTRIWFWDKNTLGRLRQTTAVGWVTVAETIIDTETQAPVADQSPLHERPLQVHAATVDSNGKVIDATTLENFYRTYTGLRDVPSTRSVLEELWDEWKQGREDIIDTWPGANN